MIVGIINTRCAGKAVLASALMSRGYSYFNINHLINRELKALKDPQDPVTFEMEKRKQFGGDYWLKLLIQQIEGGKVAVDNIAHEDEIKELRKISKVVLIAVYAPEEIKFQRELLRQKLQTIKMFNLDTTMMNSPEDEYLEQIEKCMKQVDISIPFDSSLKKLKDKIEDALDDVETKYDVPVE